MKTFLVSAFLDSPIRHGGRRRSEQIAELCNRTFGDSLVIHSILKGKWLNSLRFWSYMPLLTWALVQVALFRVSPQGFARIIAYGPSLSDALQRHQPSRILMETAPGISMLIAPWVEQRWGGAHIAIVPQNIEFLVPNSPDKSFFNEASRATWEMELYRRSSIVLTISDFDAALVRCIGAQTATLPYFPPADIVANLAEISKAKRNHGAISGSLLGLVLGTCTNKPTLDSMMSGLLTFTNQGGDCGMRFVVAGYGTEKLRVAPSDIFSILGSVSDSVLRDYLTTSSLLIVFQNQTTGFATRIVEANLCGLPILVIGLYAQAEQLESYGVFVRPALEATAVNDILSRTGFLRFDNESTTRLLKLIYSMGVP